jgi:hypothetical protein
MTFKINGVDITPYIAHGGVKWTRADVDGPNAGRKTDGKLVRDKVATKYRIDVMCKPLSLDEATTILGLIAPEWVFVTATNPFTGTVSTYTMYANNIPIAVWGIGHDGKEYWTGIEFPLIQE